MAVGYTEPCPYCGEPLDFDAIVSERDCLDLMAEAGEVYFPADLCCDEFTEDYIANRHVWHRDTELRASNSPAGSRPRSILIPDDDGPVILDFNLRVEAVDFKTAAAFVGRHHRHNRPPKGWRFGFGAFNGPDLVAVVMVGSPVAREIDKYVFAAEALAATLACWRLGLNPAVPCGFACPVVTCEVNRLCVRADIPAGLVFNACSQLYAAAAREAERRGYARAVTYTLESESAHTLKAAGWAGPVKVKGRSWDCPGRPRTDRHSTEDKWRWHRPLAPRRREAAALVAAAFRASAARAKRLARRAASGAAQPPQKIYEDMPIAA